MFLISGPSLLYVFKKESEFTLKVVRVYLKSGPSLPGPSLLVFHDGIYPNSFKYSIITPILKKPSLDLNIIANYHPISQLPFLSNILERTVAIQLNRFIADNKLYDIFQSAFRRGHSTETALQQILNNI